MVRAPVDETEVVPVPPKAAVLAERLVVEALPVVSEPEVTRPLAVSVVMPLKAPLVTSQESEAMLMVSPPSPMVKEPVVVQVEPEEMVLLPIVPPETVMALRAVVCTPAEKVEVALPCTVKKPVVVAPPLMVRPPAWVPLPIVEDAFEMSPAVNCMSVEVELPIEVGVKGKAKRLAEVT